MKISIAICCHNSAERLEPTLVHLQNQKNMQPEQWEILLIDNASHDNTIEFAKTIWAKNPITEIRFLQEKRLGLSHAREHAFQAARGEVVCFIDDDNWVNPNWCKNIIKIFENNNQTGAAGGPILPVLESKAPEWFNEFKGNFTLWDLYETAQEITHPLCGAGLCIRKSAWNQLKNQGFEQLLTDRKGSNLTSGGDFEIGYALLLNGWKLWYDPSLSIQHFIPKKRLNWNYLMRLRRGFGAQSTILEIYEKTLKSSLEKSKLKPQNWWKELMKCLWKISRHTVMGVFPEHKIREGKIEAALFADQCGRLSEILRKKKNYMI